MDKGSVTGQAMSPSLIVHYHGGGFVAQSPESHEIYLRQWAKDLAVPILSVNYTLAPEAAFPEYACRGGGRRGDPTAAGRC